MDDGNKRFERLAVALAVILWGAGPALAVDGVIEINQALALAGGVTPADTPGFPVSIDSPGSYRLTGDLTVPDENTSGVLIFNDDVTLDLNGFSIIGPVSCTTAAPTSETICTPSGGVGVGISVSSKFEYWNITIRNGTVRGMGDEGVKVEGNVGVRIEGVRAISNATHGIFIGTGANKDSAHVVDCSAIRNGGSGIVAPEGSVVRGNVANHNHLNGIMTDSGALVTQNVANRNDGVGISVGSGGLVTGNTALRNTGFGLDGGSAGFSNNVFANNNASCVNDQVDTGPVDMGGNLCCVSSTCP